MRKHTIKLKNKLHGLYCSKPAIHGHHAAYLFYYGLALLDDTGAKFWVVVVVFTFHVVETIVGE